MPEIFRSEYVEVRIGDQLIRSDKMRTAEAYRQIEAPWADQCPCTPCRNFAPQRGSAFPSTFFSLLNQLGIDASKESEVFGCYPLPSDKRQYGGWFFFCGMLVADAKGEVEADGMAYHVRGPGDMPVPNAVFEPNPLALEFTIELPWVLLDEDPDELYGPITKSDNSGAKV